MCVCVCVCACAITVAAAFTFNAQNLQQASIVILLSNYKFINEYTYTRHPKTFIYINASSRLQSLRFYR
jgi:hypothetical protein